MPFITDIHLLIIDIDCQDDGTAIDAVGHLRYGSIRTETDSGWRPHHLRIDMFHYGSHAKK